MYTQTRAAEYVHQDPVQMFITATVGTPEIQAEFQSVLRSALQNERALQTIPKWRRTPKDPFSVLLQSAEEVFHDVKVNRVLARVPNDLQPAQKAHSNSITGTRITLQALSGLGDVYQDFPYKMHQRSNVQKSMCGILRATQSIAFGDADTGMLNLRALEYGFKPATTRDEAERRIAKAKKRKAPPSGYYHVLRFDSGSFTIDQTPDDQLLVSLKHDLLKSPDGSPRCPATNTRVEGKKPDAPSRPGLHTFMRAIGEVVLDEIYPYQFQVDPSK
ncbi:MAG: hypothetical protein WBP26_01570 [Candidatus Saccharimonadales bacterium]